MKKMNCETVLIAAMAAADGHPATLETAAIEAHLSACSECRGELEALGGVVKLLDSQRRRQSDEDLWGTLEPRLLDQNPRHPASGDVKMWVPIGLILLSYKLIEQIPDRQLALLYKVLPLLLVTAVFLYLKENPFKINAELKLEGE
ncbi:MAG: zf-HC2 domain-containing protein [Blastocatellia bacterium]